VAAVVRAGWGGLVVAAVLGAIMSTISGLVNSTATMVTLDIFRRWRGRDWPEIRLVRFGQWAGGLALLFGALVAPMVMKWENIFRYCQDIWAPMAAPAVVVFLGGALWKPARERGAVACLWLAILTIPLTFAKQIMADKGIHFLPANLENSMVFAGAIFLISVVLLVQLSREERGAAGWLPSAALSALILWIAVESPAATALLVLVLVPASLAFYCSSAREHRDGYWDRSMLGLPKTIKQRWYSHLWLWWFLIGACFVAIYIRFW